MGEQGGRGIIIATIVAAVITGIFALVGQIIGALINRGAICASPVIEDVESISSAEIMTEDIEYPLSAEPTTEDNTFITEPENIQLVDDNTLRNSNGEIKFSNSKCGTAYIYKDYLDSHKVGTFYDNSEIKGWYVKIYLDNEFFMFFVKPSNNILEGEYSCYAQSGTVGNLYESYSAKIYQDIIYADLDENGNLRIIYNIVDEPPFDLSAATKLKCSIIT